MDPRLKHSGMTIRQFEWHPLAMGTIQTDGESPFISCSTISIRGFRSRRSGRGGLKNRQNRAACSGAQRSALDVETLRAHCRKLLTGYKQPKVIEFRDSLPKSAVGKILRRELR